MENSDSKEVFLEIYERMTRGSYNELRSCVGTNYSDLCVIEGCFPTALQDAAIPSYRVRSQKFTFGHP